MPKIRTLDVYWYAPSRKRKKPVAYSTMAVSNMLGLIAEDMKKLDISVTPNNIIEYITKNKLICYEEIKIMEAYIEKGYGNDELVIR